MGISYGVAICLQGHFKVGQLKPLVRDGLEELRERGAKMNVSRGGNCTLLAQGDGDHQHLWEASQHFVALASTLAKTLRCRAWAISGYSGNENYLAIERFGKGGAREWAHRNGAAMRRFQKEGGFKHEPFAALTKPFLELAKSWSPLGTIEVIGKPELQEVRGAALASLLGRPLPGAKGWRSVQRGEEGVEISSLFLELKAPKITLEKLGLSERRFSAPGFSLQQPDDLILLPGGESTRGYDDSVRGLLSTRKGKAVTLRWGHTVRSRGASWLQVFGAEGPFVAEFERDVSERREADAEAEAERGVEANDAKRVLRAVAAGGLDAETWATTAGEQGKWRCFEALVKKLPARQAKKVRNRLLTQRGWREAVDLGADVNASDEFGRTPLHRKIADPAEVKTLLAAGARLDLANYQGSTPLHLAEQPAVATMLIEAGAPLDVEDEKGMTPLARFLRPLGFSTPSAADLEVVAMLVKRGAPPSGAALLSLLAPWKKKPTHKVAYENIARLVKT